MQQRLAAGYRNAVQHALTLPQKAQHLLLIRVLPNKLRQHERGVVAERAAEIAARREHGTRDLAGVIQQRELLQSGY